MTRPTPATPERVAAARRREASRGFSRSSEDTVGRLLAALAAAVPIGGRILELGTGVGVGTAWLVTGLAGRDDVGVVSVEQDPDLLSLTSGDGWPSWVTWQQGQAEDLLPRLGMFDLIFADAEGGKWSRLDLTLDALAPGGVLVVDDMDLNRYDCGEHWHAVERVRQAISADHRLVSVELSAASGVIVASRRRDAAPGNGAA